MNVNMAAPDEVTARAEDEEQEETATGGARESAQVAAAGGSVPPVDGHFWRSPGDAIAGS